MKNKNKIKIKIHLREERNQAILEKVFLGLISSGLISLLIITLIFVQTFSNK